MDVMQDNNSKSTAANLVEVPILQQDVSKAQPIKLAFPDADYNQNGKLKTVRGRMLKKLLKYELKGLMPIFLLVGTVLSFAIFSGLSFRFVGNSENTFSIIASVLCMLVFIFSIIGSMFASWIVPVQRYDNNFFKAEGYLTFSIPASMEEQLLAKRITAVTSMLVANIGVFLGIVLFGSILDPIGFFVGFGEIFVFISEIYGGAIFPTILFIFELLLLWLVSLPLSSCLLGALCCSVHKYSEKKKNTFAVLKVMGAMYGSSMLLSVLGISGFLEFLTSVFRLEGLLFIYILLIAGIEILCMWYELRTLKKKLNLR